MARPRAGAGDAAGGLSDRSDRGQGRGGAVHRLPRGGRRRGRRPGRPAGGSGAAVAALRDRDPGRARVGTHRGRGGGLRRAAPAAGGRGGARAAVSPVAGDAGPVRSAGRNGRRIRGRGRERRPPARGSARRPRGSRGPDGGAVRARLERDRPVPPQCERAPRRASRPHGPADAAVQQRGADRGRSVHEGAGGARREPDARGRDRDAAERPAGPEAAPSPGGRGGHGFRDRGGAAGAPRGTFRLHLHRHLGRLLRGGGVPARGRRGVDRVPGAGHRERPGGAGLRRPRLRPGHRLQRAARHPVPGGDARPLPGAAGAVGAVGGAGEPPRAGLAGSHLRAARRLVAVRRRLPPAPRAGEPLDLAAGAGGCGLRGRRRARSRRVRPERDPGRDPGPGRHRGAGSGGGRRSARGVGAGRGPRRHGRGAGRGAGGSQPDRRPRRRGFLGARASRPQPAGGRQIFKRAGRPRSQGCFAACLARRQARRRMDESERERGRSRLRARRNGATRVVAIVAAGAAGRHATPRHRAPRGPGRSRPSGDDRRDSGGREAHGRKRARARARHRQRRRDAREGRVARHPRWAGGGEGARRGARRRDAVGYRQGHGPGGGPPPAEDDRPRARTGRTARRPRQRADVSRSGDPHCVPLRTPPGRPPGPGRGRRRPARAARRLRLAAGARRGRLAGAHADGTAARASRRAGRRARGGRGVGPQLLGRVPLHRPHRRGAARRGVLRPRAGDGFGRVDHRGGRPRGRAGVRHLRVGDGDQRGDGGARAGGHPGDGARDDADRVRLRGAVVRLLGPHAR